MEKLNSFLDTLDNEPNTIVPLVVATIGENGLTRSCLSSPRETCPKPDSGKSRSLTPTRSKSPQANKAETQVCSSQDSGSKRSKTRSRSPCPSSRDRTLRKTKGLSKRGRPRGRTNITGSGGQKGLRKTQRDRKAKMGAAQCPSMKKVYTTKRFNSKGDSCKSGARRLTVEKSLSRNRRNNLANKRKQSRASCRQSSRRTRKFQSTKRRARASTSSARSSCSKNVIPRSGCEKTCVSRQRLPKSILKTNRATKSSKPRKRTKATTSRKTVSFRAISTRGRSNAKSKIGKAVCYNRKGNKCSPKSALGGRVGIAKKRGNQSASSSCSPKRLRRCSNSPLPKSSKKVKCDLFSTLQFPSVDGNQGQNFETSFPDQILNCAQAPSITSLRIEASKTATNTQISRALPLKSIKLSTKRVAKIKKSSQRKLKIIPAFAYFVKQRFQSARKVGAKIPLTKSIQKASREWRKLSAKEKSRYAGHPVKSS